MALFETLREIGLSEEGVTAVKDNGLDEEDLYNLSTEDITDLCPSKFKDRCILRKIASEKRISGSPASSSPPSLPHTMPIDSSSLSSGGTQATASMMTVPELLKPKSLRKKASTEQKFFHSLLRNAAKSSGIWKRCPTLNNISSQRRQCFEQAIISGAPQLESDLSTVWVRLGRILQNRRKYVLDKELGKRRSCVQKPPTSEASRNSTTTDHSPTVSHKHMLPTATLVSRKPAAATLSHQPVATVSRQPPATCSTVKSPEPVAAVMSHQPAAANGLQQPVVAKLIHQPAGAKVVHQPVTSTMPDKPPAAKVMLTEPVAAMVSRQPAVAKVPHQPTAVPATAVRRPTAPTVESPKSAAATVNPGEDVFVVNKTGVTLGKGIFLRNFDDTKMYAEILFMKHIKHTGIEDSELPVPVSGKTEFSQLQVSEIFVWKVSLLRAELADKPHAKKKQGVIRTNVSEVEADSNSKVAIFEWNKGQIFLGSLSKDNTEVQNCRKPIDVGNDARAPSGGQVKLSKVDIQLNPDMEYCLWEIPTSIACLKKNDLTVKIIDEGLFREGLKKAAEKYFE